MFAEVLTYPNLCQLNCMMLTARPKNQVQFMGFAFIKVKLKLKVASAFPADAIITCLNRYCILADPLIQKLLKFVFSRHLFNCNGINYFSVSFFCNMRMWFWQSQLLLKIYCRICFGSPDVNDEADCWKTAFRQLLLDDSEALSVAEKCVDQFVLATRSGAQNFFEFINYHLEILPVVDWIGFLYNWCVSQLL